MTSLFQPEVVFQMKTSHFGTLAKLLGIEVLWWLESSLKVAVDRVSSCLIIIMIVGLEKLDPKSERRRLKITRTRRLVWVEILFVI